MSEALLTPPARPRSSSSAPASAAEPTKEERKSRVTIKDVAKAAGVHFTTVSLALREHRSIPTSTREYIRATADRLGYVPNPVFQALTHFHLNGRVRAAAPRIAYLINNSLENGAVLYRHQEVFLDGVRSQARVLGYEIEQLSVGDGQHDSRSLERYLRSKNINGIIIGAFEPGFSTLSLDWDNYAVVKINSLHMEPRSPVVGNDQRQDVRLAFRQMYSRGYRRIGLAVGRADEDGTEHRYTAGYLIEQATVPAEDRVPELLFPYNPTAAQVSELLGRWVRQHRVDAVLCNWCIVDEMLQSAGFRVPQEVACACLCLLDKNSHLAGVCPNLHMVGIKAMSLLTTLLKSGERGVPEFASRTYVRSYWQEGETAPVKR